MNTQKWLVTIFLLAFFCAISTTARTEDLSGRQIMELEEDRNKADDEYNKMSMKLIHKSGKERNRRVEYYQ